MPSVILTDPPRTPIDHLDALARFGVATTHEALGRIGLTGPELRPIQQGVRIAGSAVTVLSAPGDNLMIHAAVEQCRAGDILVVGTTSISTDGMFGELFATALMHRGVRGLVIDAGVRDTQELREHGFPVWSRAVSAQGTVKATPGSVNVPLALGRAIVHAGDAVVADDDGVMIVPRARAAEAIEKSTARVAKEQADLRAYAGGQLSLDRKGLRGDLEALGVRYVPFAEYDGS